VAHYAVEERRITAGRVDEYLEVTEAIHRSLVSARGRLAMRVYVCESDSDAVLAVSGWAQRRDAAAAEQMLQMRHLARLSELTREAKRLRWFVTEREIATFMGQPTVAAASLMTVAAADVPAMLEWARRGQDRAAEMDGVIATQVLRGEDEPGHLLFLIEYRDEAGRAAMQAMVAADRPPARLLHKRVFVGRIGRRWDRGDPA
jgi:heme-degrading monooxygenase HmoA